MADNPNSNANQNSDTDDAGGIANRSYSEERDDQEALPARGTSRDDSRNMGVGNEVETDRDERRSER